MPKIPTFTAKGTPTAQVGGVRTNLKLSPFATAAAALVPVAQKAEEYYLKQRDRTDTIEANKVRIEIKSKADEIIGREKNNIDEFNSVNNFSTDYDNFLKTKLDSIQNKRVKTKVENLVSLDTPDYIYQVKKNSRTAADVEDVNVYNTIQEQTASRYYVTDDVKLKKDYENKMIFEAQQHNQKNNLGKTALDKDIRGIKSDLFLSDVDKLIANKEYTKAENKLKDVDSSPFLDNDDRQKRLIKIQKEGVEYRATSYGVGQILQGKNPLIGEGIKGTTDKKIIDATDNTLISIAQKNKFNEEQTFAFVDDTYAKVGMVSNLYEETIDSGYTAGSATTFDNEADIPAVLLQAVKVAEVADKIGRLSVYTDEKEQTFFENVIVAKKILGLDNFQAIKTAKEMENNYDLSVIKGANKARNRTFKELETEFKKLQGTNIGEVRGYADKVFNMYVISGIGPKKAKDLTVENIKKNIIVVDNYAYMKRDIDAFKSIGALGQIKSFKEYIINEQMIDQDPDEYFLRYNDGGLFEIRGRLDISPVYNKDGQPMIYYPKDLYKMFKEREAKGRAEIKKETQLEQEKKQKIKEETAITGIDVTGA
jgi:hypothetical protein